MPSLPFAPVKRIMKKAGAQRVSKGAVQEFARLLEEYGEEIAKEAVKNTKRSGRKTVDVVNVSLGVALLNYKQYVCESSRQTKGAQHALDLRVGQAKATKVRANERTMAKD